MLPRHRPARIRRRMPSLPIPFVVALFLMLLFRRLWTSSDDKRGSAWGLLLLAACIAHAVVVGLRWGYGLPWLDVVQPVLGASLPPLAWLGFEAIRTGRLASGWRWLHMLPVVSVAGLRGFDAMAVDSVLILSFLGYGAALLLHARQGPDALVRTALDTVAPVHAAMRACGFALLAFAALDSLVALAIALGRRDMAANAIGLAGLAMVCLLGMAAARSSGAAPGTAESADADAANGQADRSEGDHAAVMARIGLLLRDQRLHLDAGLTLGRLARRAGVPARQVSAAINALHGVNVSQYINGFRIHEACHLLEASNAPVTGILLEAGFNTKSNFNREFQRVTGMTPSAWRERHRRGASVREP